jgi:hypothetical protein
MRAEIVSKARSELAAYSRLLVVYQSAVDGSVQVTTATPANSHNPIELDDDIRDRIAALAAEQIGRQIVKKKAELVALGITEASIPDAGAAPGYWIY